MTRPGTARGVVTLVLVWSLLGVAVGAPVGSANATAEPNPQTDVEGDVLIENYDPPDVLERDRTYSTDVTIENGGDQDYRIELGYHFEGEFVTIERLHIEPGESIRESLSFQVSDIESAAQAVTSGEAYRHGVAVTIVTRDGDRIESDRVDGEVRIASDNGDVSENIEFDAAIPDVLERDQENLARVRIVNHRDSPAQLELGYLFEGTVIESGEVELEPDAAFEEELPIQVAPIEDELGPLDPDAEYTHEVAIRSTESGNILDRVRQPVRVAPPDEERPTEDVDDTDQEVVQTDADDDEAEHRGFLTNDPGSSIAFLDDPMFLTVIGFVLSIVGILYQMTSGG